MLNHDNSDKKVGFFPNLPVLELDLGAEQSNVRTHKYILILFVWEL